MKAAAAEETGGESVSRRGLMAAAGIGSLALGGSLVLSGAALSRFMFPNALEEPDPRVRAGELAQYLEMPINSVSEAHKPQGIWIVRLEDAIVAVSTTCTHLGCILNWVESQRQFKCPCHGSGFAPSGINLEGPAPRPLERFGVFVEGDIVVVDRSKTFRQEKGQWSDPASFIGV